MFSYDIDEMKFVLSKVLQQNVPEETLGWLRQQASSTHNINNFNTTFVTIPRKTGKRQIAFSADDRTALQKIRPGFNITGWSSDRLARVWLLLHLDAADHDKYYSAIENLFLAAEVNELVALYSALPLLAYPETWKSRCAEGIRTNIADVLQAIVCNNPYPAEQLNEAAFNQLVLKAFFTEKPIEQIIGLDERANENLANTLSDYAHERWAAHREVNPQLWRCVAPFIDDTFLADIKKAISSANEVERKAGSLAAFQSKHPAAKQLIPHEYLSDLQSGNLTWKSLFDKTNDHVLQQ